MTDMEQLLAVAKMYYEQGLTQQEIAEKVFLSRSHVSRMLKEARALGIVEIIIRSPFENHVSLEISLAERFGMEKILVAYTENTGPREEFNSVCSMGASYLNSILTNRSVLAVSKGKTVAATIGALKPSKTLPDMRFVQLAGSMEASIRISTRCLFCSGWPLCTDATASACWCRICWMMRRARP